MRASVYVHVPFCVSKCSYCDFHSRSGFSALDVRDWAEGIRVELDDGLSRFRIDETATVYVGGGTPTAVGARALGETLGTIRRALPALPREWTVEANPESLDEASIEAMLSSGVDRISIGVQSLEGAALAEAGRPHRPDDALRAMERAVGAGLRVSCDLIAGLPASSTEGFADSARLCAESGAGHVSVYALTVEPSTPFASRSDLPDEDAVCDQLEAAGSVLRGSGLARYEVSNWAREGQECVHNLSYWSMDSWLGVGPSAVSCVRDGARATRRERGKSLDLRDCREYRVDAPECAFETLMMGLRMVGGVDREAFARRFGVDVVEAFRRTVESRSDAFAVTERSLALTKRWMDRMNAILVDALSERDEPCFARRFPR